MSPMFSKILTVITLCAFYSCVSVDARRHGVRSLNTLHQPSMNPALHYYRSTGRDPSGKPKGPSASHDHSKRDLPWLKSQLNYTELSGPLEKRHMAGASAHKETTVSAYGWNDAGYPDGFLEFCTFFIQEVEEDARNGKISVPTGCRPVFAACTEGGSLNGLEYLEVCNYAADARVVDRREVFERIWAMFAPKIWDLSASWRYQRVRNQLHIDQDKWSGKQGSLQEFAGLTYLSSFLLAYSWSSDDPTMGVAFYKDPPIRNQTEMLREKWSLECSTFA